MAESLRDDFFNFALCIYGYFARRVKFTGLVGSMGRSNLTIRFSCASIVAASDILAVPRCLCENRNDCILSDVSKSTV